MREVRPSLFMELPTHTTTPPSGGIHYTFQAEYFLSFNFLSHVLVVSSLSPTFIRDIPVILTLIIKHALYLDCYILIESLSAWNIRVQNVINW